MSPREKEFREMMTIQWEPCPTYYKRKHSPEDVIDTLKLINSLYEAKKAMGMFY